GDLADLLRHRSPLSAGAARALGQIHPDPLTAVPALNSLLCNGDTTQREAAAEGLVALVRGMTPPAARGPAQLSALQGEFVALGRLVIPVATGGLKDNQLRVRLHCLEVIAQTATLLTRLLQESRSPEELP